MGLGLAFPAGLNAYIPLLTLACAARFTNLVTLASPYDALSSNAGIGVLTLLLAVEVVADKVPLVDHANDLIQTVVRPASGAILMLSSTGAVEHFNPTLAVILGILAAGSVHTVKAVARPAVTVTTGGLGNPIVSTVEDVIAFISSVAAIVLPLLVILTIPAFVAFIAVLARRRLRRRRRSLADPQH
jgi:hypothetical protein